MTSIKGLNRVDLLEELWKGANKFQGFDPMHAAFMKAISGSQTFDRKKAEIHLARTGYVDYFQERPIKCDLSGDTVNFYAYNRDAGEGAGEEIVKKAKR